MFLLDAPERPPAHIPSGPRDDVVLEPAVDAKTDNGAAPTVGIIMGSDSDWKTMQPAARVLDGFGVPYEAKVVSAHRTPDYLFDYAGTAEERGLSLIIAGAGGAAHLPGMAASKTIVPVVGVPVEATPLGGLDALLSIMQMPSEVGVATVSVGQVGASNAASFAVAALASLDPSLRARLLAVRGARPGAVTTAKAAGKVVILARQDAELEVLRYSRDYLGRLDVAHETVILEPQVAPGGLGRRLADLEASGAAVFIVGSEGGIDFACEVARATTLPVLGVPIVSPPISCIDEFLRPFLTMPPGVATLAVGKPGAINAALFAATIISGRGSEVWERLRRMRKEQDARVRAMTVSAV
jgi:5-(carboxyamino)imidazole ribonucleotide mutase